MNRPIYQFTPIYIWIQFFYGFLSFALIASQRVQRGKMYILFWVAILPLILARMSNATEEQAEIKAEIKRELKEELTSELLSRCMSNASKQEDNLFMGEAVITRDDCDAAKFHNVNRIEFSLDIDSHDDKDCYAEITFPHERDFKLIVLNFKVRKSSILRVSF